jgi:hypothetical protein
MYHGLCEWRTYTKVWAAKFWAAFSLEQYCLEACSAAGRTTKEGSKAECSVCDGSAITQEMRKARAKQVGWAARHVQFLMHAHLRRLQGGDTAHMHSRSSKVHKSALSARGACSPFKKMQRHARATERHVTYIGRIAHTRCMTMHRACKRLGIGCLCVNYPWNPQCSWRIQPCSRARV